jgi:hypothetical protein
MEQLERLLTNMLGLVVFLGTLALVATLLVRWAT